MKANYLMLTLLLFLCTRFDKLEKAFCILQTSLVLDNLSAMRLYFSLSVRKVYFFIVVAYQLPLMQSKTLSCEEKLFQNCWKQSAGRFLAQKRKLQKSFWDALIVHQQNGLLPDTSGYVRSEKNRMLHMTEVYEWFYVEYNERSRDTAL